jgi:hypothetical protein
MRWHARLPERCSAHGGNPGLTIEEHAAFGKELKAFMSSEFFNRVWGKYQKTSKQAQALSKAFDAIQTLRFAMEDDICQLVPENDPVWNWIRFYCGEADEDPRRVHN